MFQRNEKNNRPGMQIEKTLREMQTWLRKTEQSTESVSARLTAVEQRLSSKTRKSHPQWYIDADHQHNGNNQLRKAKYDRSDSDIDLSFVQPALAELDERLMRFQDQLNDSVSRSSNGEIMDLKKQIDEIRQSMDYLKNNHLKSSVMMNVKGRQIPLEITGIIGGILTFIIAALIGLGGKNIVVSPLFLAGIGSVLIASSVFRTMNHTQVIKRWLSNSTTPESEKHY